MFKGILLCGALTIGLMCSSTAHALVAEVIHSGTNNPTSENAYSISQSLAHSGPWTASITGNSTSGAQNGGWNINSTVTGGADAFYVINPLGADVSSANTLGWAMEVQVEVLARTAVSGSSVVSWNYLSTLSPNFVITLTRDSAGTLTATTNSGGSYVVPVSSGYHTYLLTHPSAGTGTLFVDGTSAITGLTGSGGPFGFNQITWGDSASGTQGNANFQDVVWTVPVPEPMAAGLIGLAGLVLTSRRRKVK
jgi:hypothetical protein